VQPAEINLNCPRRLFKSEKEKLKLPKLLSVTNLHLHNKRLRVSAPKSELKMEPACAETSAGRQNAWSALRAAKEKARQRRTSSVLVPLFYQVRTYFQNKH